MTVRYKFILPGKITSCGAAARKAHFADAAMHVARRISDAFTARTDELDLGSVRVGLSIGVGHRDLSDPRSAEDLVRHADEAMYAAKASASGSQRVFVRARGGAMLSAAA